MKKILLFFILLFLLGACVYCQNMPMALIYPPSLLGDADKNDENMVLSVFKNYLKKTEKIDTIVFSAEMPSVLLALKEEKLTTDDVSLTASDYDKIKTAKALLYDYLFLPELNRDDKVFEININVYDLAKDSLKNYGSVVKINGDKTEGSINSAISGIVIQLIRDIFNETASFSAGDTKNDEEEKPDYSIMTAKDLSKLAQKEAKNKNYSQAILLFTKAIDKSPDDAELRLKLADAYYGKQLYKEALDQFYNALNIGYRGEDLYKLKQKYESMVRAGDYVKPTEEIKKEYKLKNKKPETDKNKEETVIAPPKLSDEETMYNIQIVNLLKEADALWKGGKNKEALVSYSEIIKKFPRDYRAYERMSLVYANNTDFANCSSVLKLLQNGNIDYDTVQVTKRINTISGIINTYYLNTIKNLKGIKSNLMFQQGSAGTVKKLNSFSSKTDDALNLIAVLGNQSASFHITNLTLTGNLINSAVSGMLDYIQAGDYDGLNTAEDFLSQAEVRISSIKYQ